MEDVLLVWILIQVFPPPIDDTIQSVGVQDNVEATASRRQWEGHGLASLRTLSSASDELEFKCQLYHLYFCETDQSTQPHWPSVSSSIK